MQPGRRLAQAVEAPPPSRRSRRALRRRVERREPGWRVHGSARRAVVAKRADDLVDLAGRLARQLLDCFERRLGALGVLPHPGAAGPHRDDVDGVAGGVVEVAGDPGPLFGDGEATLALSLALGDESALPQRCDPLAAKAGPLTREPRDGKVDARVEQLAPRKAALPISGRTEDREEQRDDRSGVPSRPGILLVATRREQIQRGGRDEEDPWTRRDTGA